MPQNHVKELQSTRLTSSGAVSAAGCRIHAISFVAAATAGSIVLKIGGSGGVTQHTFDTPASAAAYGFINIPGDGLWMTTDCYATLTNITGVTFLWSPEKTV